MSRSKQIVVAVSDALLAALRGRAGPVRGALAAHVRRVLAGHCGDPQLAVVPPQGRPWLQAVVGARRGRRGRRRVNGRKQGAREG